MKILVIEDDQNIQEALVHILQQANYTVDAVSDGMDGLYYASNYEYDALILDVMLPKMNGYDVMKTLRGQKVQIPTIMLTAKGEVDDKVKGLDCGADDYLVKPFAPKEMLARLRAMLRRKGEIVMDELEFGDIVLNLNAYTMNCAEKSTTLSNKEFQIMSILIQNKSTIVSKEKLICKVWGDDSDATDNNVEAYVSFLRKKLAYVGSNIVIKSMRMVGYRLENKDDD